MSEKDIKDLLSLTSSGLEVASFNEIKTAIINRYKSAYGSDINIIDTNADGIFINDLSLIINNVLQSVKSLYNNLNIDVATGKYLEVLCKLSNVIRKDATYSTANITLTNNSESEVIIFKNTKFLDINNTTWTYLEDNISISANGSITINVKCDETGPVQCSAGTINNFLEIIEDIEITQSDDGIKGTNIESDEELRARRNRSNSSLGNTVMESLIGHLLELPTIKDVIIVNNNTNEEITLSDTTVVAPHTIYIVIRDIRHDSAANDNITNNKIAQIIYDELTPGIGTQECADPVGWGTSMSVKYTPIVGDISYEELGNNIYWKLASGISPDEDKKIAISLHTLDNYDSSVISIIKEKLVEYINNLPLNYRFRPGELYGIIYDCDTKPFGISTFYIDNIEYSLTHWNNLYSYYNITTDYIDITVT